VISLELLLLAVAVFMLHVELPLLDILVMIGLYITFNGLTWVRLRKAVSRSELEFFIYLAVDVLMLAVLFYFSGGSSNPFVSLFLLPLVIVATILPKSYVWMMALIVLACYTFLMVVYVPLNDDMRIIMAHPTSRSSGFGMHVVGMWFSFLLGVGVVLFFVASMAEALRQRDKKLAEAREKSLRDEHMIVLGTMAAGVAHELGTPLATIAVVTREMERDHSDQPELLADIEILRSQMARCKVALGQLSASAGQLRAESGRGQSLEGYLQQMLGEWQKIHPNTALLVELAGQSHPIIVVDETLNQALCIEGLAFIT